MIKNDLIHIDFGDCRNLIKNIESETVAIAVTSPPYNIGKPYGKYKDRITLGEWKQIIIFMLYIMNYKKSQKIDFN